MTTPPQCEERGHRVTDVEDLARLVGLVIGSGAAEIRPVVPAPSGDAS